MKISLAQNLLYVNCIVESMWFTHKTDDVFANDNDDHHDGNDDDDDDDFYAMLTRPCSALCMYLYDENEVNAYWEENPALRHQNNGKRDDISR